MGGFSITAARSIKFTLQGRIFDCPASLVNLSILTRKEAEKCRTQLRSRTQLLSNGILLLS